MEPPAEFRKLARRMIQDIFEICSDVEDLLDFLVEGLNEGERTTTKEYLSDLLKADPDVSELQELWHDAGAEAGVGDEQAIQFFTMIRNRL